METTPLDSSLPGVRLLQSWIRERCPLSIEVLGAERLEGRLVWQDPNFWRSNGRERNARC